MTNEPENPSLDDQTLLGGLNIVFQGLEAFFNNLIVQKTEGAERLPAKVVAALGMSMIETGGALAGRAVNDMPDGVKFPPFPADTLPGTRPGQG